MPRLIMFYSLIILVLLVSLSLAGIPHLINYQGMLTQSDGKTPVTNGNYSLTFKIYGSESGTDSLWREYHSTVIVTNGLFNVILGSVTTLNLAFDTDYWLGIKVGTDPELSPRIRLTSVGYAYRAQKADTASVAISAPSGGGWTDDGTNVRLTTSTDKVGIGVASPLGKLHINTSGWDAAHLYLEAPSYGHSRILQANDGLLIKNFYATGTNTAFSFRNPTDVHLLDIRADGNVGIGTTNPAEKLQVAGVVHSTSGGFKFPDGTTQATAASGAGGGWTDDGTNVRLTTSTDKVGIGTSSPETYSKLHVVVPRTQSFDRVTIECPRDSNGFGIELKQPGGYWRLGQNVGNGWNDYFTITNNISPYYRLTILSDGKVGIGTTDPAYKLDVRGDRIQLKEDATGHWMAMRTDGDALDFQFQGGNLYLQSTTAGQNILLNPTTSSNVGIGMTTPGTKLDVTSSSGTALRAVTTSASGWGIDASAKEGGAHIFDSDGSGNAYIAHGHTGVEAYGNDQGGYFQDADNGAYAHVGYGNRGIEAKGTEVGGYFQDSDNSGYARVGYFDDGIDGRGNFAGGDFEDLNSGSWAWVGYDNNKIFGIGLMQFVQNHPYEKDRVIAYTAPEGDEAATYTRGTARLVNGEARVMLGETFKWVTDPEIGLTAHITPRADCKGLYVASLTTSEMVVKELQGGTSDAAFDYLVYGLRIGFEETSVVQEKIREAYIPSLASHRERYNKYPELRHFNALERFRQMYSQIGKPFDLGASRVLRDAIHEFDPAIDRLPEPDKR
jgi:hypothetical protein